MLAPFYPALHAPEEELIGACDLCLRDPSSRAGHNAAQSFHLLYWLTAACPLALLHGSLHDGEALTHL